ncbi:MAG: hypothetical protein H6Q15_390 [Bacteroidetes bacterium]|nr:hypothetical protein [Bacteroidota bacterium]
MLQITDYYLYHTNIKTYKNFKYMNICPETPCLINYIDYIKLIKYWFISIIIQYYIYWVYYSCYICNELIRIYYLHINTNVVDYICSIIVLHKCKSTNVNI